MFLTIISISGFALYAGYLVAKFLAHKGVTRDYTCKVLE